MSKYKIRKRKLLEFLNDKKTPPLKFGDIAIMLDVQSHEKDQLQGMLNEAVKEGSLEVSKRGLYRPAQKPVELKGTYMATKGEFGFIRPEEEGADDFFVPPGKNLGAMNGDTVLYKRDTGDTAIVVKIVNHAIVSFTGVVTVISGRKYVDPLVTKTKGLFIITDQDTVKVSKNDLVHVEIIKYNVDYTEVRVIEKVGNVNDPYAVVESIIRDFGIKREFPNQVLVQIKNLLNETSGFEDEGRTDFRSLPTVTIDGSDAKDLDDAISLQMCDNGNFKLYVHIADVSEYVTQGTHLDREALRRGTSIYFPDDVIPMLPKELSNGICSLNPDEDRLTLSAVMEIDSNGKVVDHDVTESIIRSDRRLTYDYVQELIDNGFSNPEQDDKIEMLQNMYRLYRILKKRRDEKGAINFDFAETKIILDKNRHPKDVMPYRTGESNGLIEEFMLISNETVAEHFGMMEIPFVFRIHEFPDPADIRALSSFVSVLGFKLKYANNIRPAALAQLVEEAIGTDYEEMVHTTVLRSMKKAIYSPVNVGHFGLASDHYCHFTSPIRRYPDLLIHRIIKSVLRGTMDYKNTEPLKEYVKKAAHQSSETERGADDVEREIVDFYKCLYMKGKIGETFEGIISDVNKAGIRVRLKNTVSGIIFYRGLDDYYQINEQTMTATGEASGIEYRVGDKIEVTVSNVDVQSRLIEFITDEHGMDYDEDMNENEEQ